jgi:plasmid stabilization system protein ParE
MSQPYAVSFVPVASLRVQKERTWLHNNRGLHAADAFEAELRRTLELLADNPELGRALDERKDRRRIYLPESGFHVFYVVHHKKGTIRVFRIRHHAQRPLKG